MGGVPVHVPTYRFAPVAETGARAIAGTVNIVTRGGYTRRVNDVRLGVTQGSDTFNPLATWSRNATVGPFVLNGTVSAAYRRSDDRSVEQTEARRLDDDTLVLRRREEEEGRVAGRSLHASGRVEWRLPGQAGQLLLMPLWIAADSDRTGIRTLQPQLGDDVPYTRAESATTSGYSMARLHATWTRRLDDGRVEVKANAQGNRSQFDGTRDETLVDGNRRRLDTRSRLRDRTFGASAKLNRLLRESHTLVSGVEVERNHRDDGRESTLDGQPVVTGFGDAVSADTTRVALYAQDEWDVAAHWAAHVGLRWEQIRTEGTAPLDLDAPVNRSSVWTPLLHVLWKPDPKRRDQVRLSLTRSYKSPTLNQLIARPRLNTTRPPPGPNAPTDADYAGNADLRPELATGLDVAIERYLPGSGVLSVNVFHRRIRDYLRSQTALEGVPWSDVPRYVTRPRNVGRAMTQGVELEAKFRASEVWAGAPRIDLRANASAFRSKVAAVAGPDNRLDDQPPYTANLGADHRFAAVPLTLGGSANWSPGYTTRLSETQSARQNARWQFDAYALWTFNPACALRVSLADIAARDRVYGSSVDGPDASGLPARETSRVSTAGRMLATVRLEMKL